MSGRLRVAMGAASLALVTAVLAGCTSGSGGAAPDAPGGLTPSPAKSAAAGELPAGSAIEDWADAALPPDRPGGSGFVARSSGELAPGMDAVIDLAQPVGQWDLAIVCQSADGSALTLTPAPVQKNELPPLSCAAPGEALAGDTGSITFDGGTSATLTLSADAAAVYAYQISPHVTAQD